MNYKICMDCQESKTIDNFHIKTKNTRHPRCKECRKEFTKRYRATRFAYGLRRNFKMSPEKYKDIFESQDSRCKICSSDKPRGSQYWVVDHDHRCCPSRITCGECVRGILCSECNLMLCQLEKIVLRMNVANFNFRDYIDGRA